MIHQYAKEKVNKVRERSFGNLAKRIIDMGMPIYIRNEEVRSWHLQDREIKDCKYRFLVDIGRPNGRDVLYAAYLVLEEIANGRDSNYKAIPVEGKNFDSLRKVFEKIN